MEDQGFHEDPDLQLRYRRGIRKELEKLNPPYSEEELSRIAGIPTDSGLFSKNDVYNAFRAAGLGPDDSLRQVRKRVW